MFCRIARKHEPNTVCEACGLRVDQYGNTEEDFLNCSFPDCGCDGHRLCMAPSGANSDSFNCNVEGMYFRTDREAIRGRLGVLQVSARTSQDQQ